MAYTGRLPPKGAPKRVAISRIAVYAVKGRDICLLSIPKGFLLRFFEQVHLMAAAFNFFKRYMGMARRPPVSVLVDLFRCLSWCTKEAPILSRMVYKGVKDWTFGRNLSLSSSAF